MYIEMEYARESHHDPTIESSQKVESDLDRRVLSSTAGRFFVTDSRIVFAVFEGNLVLRGSIGLSIGDDRGNETSNLIQEGSPVSLPYSIRIAIVSVNP